jgi:hypothetical protein
LKDCAAIKIRSKLSLKIVIKNKNGFHFKGSFIKLPIAFKKCPLKSITIYQEARKLRTT